MRDIPLAGVEVRKAGSYPNFWITAKKYQCHFPVVSSELFYGFGPISQGRFDKPVKMSLDKAGQAPSWISTCVAQWLALLPRVRSSAETTFRFPFWKPFWRRLGGVGLEIWATGPPMAGFAAWTARARGSLYDLLYQSERRTVYNLYELFLLEYLYNFKLLRPLKVSVERVWIKSFT